jgi:hypothetical protein
VKQAILHLLLALALTGCMGSVISGQAACDSDVSQITQITGECTRTIDALEKKETQHIAVQTSDIVPFATVDIQVTVETGTVKVTFKDARGNVQEEEASPDNPATLSVPVQLDGLNQINFDLEPVGGPATGVDYALSFVCECLP